MRLLFKQRLFSWFDSYDIYDEDGRTVYTVEGKLSWGHCLHILDARGEHIGTVQEKVFTLLPKFELYIHDQYVGSIQKQFTFFQPRFTITMRNGLPCSRSWRNAKLRVKIPLHTTVLFTP